MEENSKKMKSGLEKAPHRSLLYALGLTREEMERPLVGVVNAASEVVPGHLHLGKLAEAVKASLLADPELFAIFEKGDVDARIGEIMTAAKQEKMDPVHG